MPSSKEDLIHWGPNHFAVTWGGELEAVTAGGNTQGEWIDEQMGTDPNFTAAVAKARKLLEDQFITDIEFTGLVEAAKMRLEFKAESLFGHRVVDLYAYADSLELKDNGMSEAA